MKKLCDETDMDKDRELKLYKDELAKTSGFRKLIPYNNPKYLIAFALISSLVGGAAQPVFAIFFSKILAILTPDIDVLEIVLNNGKGWVFKEASRYCLYMFLVAIAAGVTSFG
jgi:hypothetical protein